MPQSNCPNCDASIEDGDLVPRDVDPVLEAMSMGVGNFNEHVCPSCA
jgi:hypothetical protein